MNVYIYQADLYCEDCGEEIAKGLPKPDGCPDENMWDSDDYPKGPYPDGGGESDSPAHCGGCGVFLENPLTSDGYAYVERQIENQIAENSVVQTWFDYYSFRITD